MQFPCLFIMLKLPFRKKVIFHVIIWLETTNVPLHLDNKKTLTTLVFLRECQSKRNVSYIM